MKLRPEARKAILLGGLCSVSYLAVYVARNILGAASPQMIKLGALTENMAGDLSSIYFVCYALGQLINGRIGDFVKAKYMISAGLILAGICNWLFPVFSGSAMAQYIIYGMTGLFLSMIYAPMSKLVAENTEPLHATRCSLGYTFASLLGSPLAGILAAGLLWIVAFRASAAVLILMGSLCFLVFTLFERKGLITYGKYKKEKSANSVRVLLQHQIVKFMLIAILTGVVRTTVVFWLPTYMSQYLRFSEDTAAQLFSVATLGISLSAFVSVFVYERLKQNMDLTILLSFIFATVGFLGAFLVQNPAINIVCLVVAILSSNCADAMMWSRYCPSLRDTGMVSGATGFLDCLSYLAAAAASKLFSGAVTGIGWGNLILVWMGLMVLGVVVALPFKKRAA